MTENQNASITLNRSARVFVSTHDAGQVGVIITRNESKRQYYRADGQRLFARIKSIVGGVAWSYQEHQAHRGRATSYLCYDAPLECAEGCSCPDCSLDAIGGGDVDAHITFDWPDFVDAADVAEYTPSGWFDGLAPDKTISSHVVLAIYRDGLRGWTWADQQIAAALVAQGFVSSDGELLFCGKIWAESVERMQPQIANDGFWHNHDDNDSDLDRRD